MRGIRWRAGKQPGLAPRLYSVIPIFALGDHHAPMRTLILGFAAGAAWLQTQASLPPHAGALLWVVAGAALLVAWLLRRHARWRCVLAPAAGVGLGFYWAAWLAQAALAPQLAPADEGRDITVTGTIASLPYRFEQGVRFNFAVEKALGAKVPPLIALSWYAGFRDEVTNEVGDVQPGELWRLTVRLQRPHGNANPPHTGEFVSYGHYGLQSKIKRLGEISDDHATSSFPGIFGAEASILIRIKDSLTKSWVNYRVAFSSQGNGYS